MIFDGTVDELSQTIIESDEPFSPPPNSESSSRPGSSMSAPPSYKKRKVSPKNSTGELLKEATKALNRCDSEIDHFEAFGL